MDDTSMQEQQANLQAIMNQDSPESPSRDVKSQGNEPSTSQEPTKTSEWQQKLQQTTQEPYNTSAWNALITFAESSGDVEKIKEAYDALLAKFPNTPSAQINYLSHFLTNSSSFAYAESLFARFLRTSPSVELWKFYINYVRRVNTGPATRDTVGKAYDFALNHVGQDKDSGEIWAEYLQFLKAGETATTWEEQQKMDALRRVFQRAVQIPLENVEILWKDYEAFERGLNQITAKKFMADLSPAHMTAKTKLRELRKLVLPLASQTSSSSSSSSTPSRIPLDLPSKPIFSSSDRSLVGSWKAYLKWEEGNPLELGEGSVPSVNAAGATQTGGANATSNSAVQERERERERERTTFISRVQGVYRKAVGKMRFFAEIWFMGYTFLLGVGKQDDALSFLKQGIDANPSSVILNLALAESLELSANSASSDAKKTAIAEIHATYNRLLRAMQTDLEEAEKKVAAATAAETEDGTGDLHNNDIMNDMDGPSLAYPQSLDVNGRSPSKIIKEESGSSQATTTSTSSMTNATDKERAEKELRSLRQEYGLVYILYIRFAMRAEGIDASRAAFARARKDKWSPWEVFESAALMEYHVAKQLGVASKILGLAHGRFPDEIDFVVRYLQFLISVNDENNARSLFERAIVNPKFTPDLARPLWEAWARYEYQYGNLEAAIKLEKRMAEAYPNDPPIKRFAQRHSYHKIDAIANRDLGFSAMRDQPKSTIARTDTLPTVASPTAPGPGSSQLISSLSGSTNKRPSSPDRPLRREDSKAGGDHGGHGPPHKRIRDISPSARGDRDRWGGPSGKDRRYGSPAWDRERDRERERSPPHRRGRGFDREEEKTALPQVLSWFAGQLPQPKSFDGPVFRTDDLLQLFRNAVIPSGTRARSPPPPPRPSRPPPDYGPYQGPGGGQRGRRY
ncbi:Suf-domain-containing protein [Schizopora paradoxa]|uniref:mRNA 3'-end-processing protein RNA14 n=1 Tax=Schizopora paradoxa TaxID=27342 RepID=A0A0H2R9P3_9AGAM|nr:Suf-domain-containing protein [Schizopora paradoxa]